MPESMSEERLAHISLYFDRRSISPDDSSNTVWRFGRDLRDEVVRLHAELAREKEFKADLTPQWERIRREHEEQVAEIGYLCAELTKYEPVIRAARDWHFHDTLPTMDDYALICNALHLALEALGPELPKE